MPYLIQIIVAIALIVVVVIQPKGTGLGSAFGGSGMYHSKRGLEKSLFYLTIALSLVFVILSAANAL
jgi:preprotein translocase subunit SecG